MSRVLSVLQSRSLPLSFSPSLYLASEICALKCVFGAGQTECCLERESHNGFISVTIVIEMAITTNTLTLLFLRFYHDKFHQQRNQRGTFIGAIAHYTAYNAIIEPSLLEPSS